MDPSLTATSWLAAADDLGISVDVDAGFSCQAGGAHECVRVLDFGGAGGTVACPLTCSQTGRSHDLAEGEPFEEQGYYFALVSDSYVRYDRDLFVATLDDLGMARDGLAG